MKLAIFSVVMAACGGAHVDEPVMVSPEPARAVAVAMPAPAPAPHGTVRSNILRADYAGSTTCGDCHAAIYTSWLGSPMHRMTRPATAGEIRAPFDGSSLASGGDRATMTERDGIHYIQLRDREYRVTKVIGGRQREDYVGVAPGEPEQVMPVSYVFATQSWRYKGYSILISEHSRLRPQAVWSQACIACHNTLPQLVTLYDALLAPEVPGVYQGTYTDNLLPADRTWRVAPVDPAGLAHAVGDEVARIGGSVPAAPLRTTLARAVGETRRHLGEKDFVELGIGCETCHGGAAEHVAAPEVTPAFAPTSPLLRAAPPVGRDTRASAINRACARCHTVLTFAYPWTWEGGRRDDAVPGGSPVNSSEGRDFQLGGCSSRLACTTCHDPHAGGTKRVDSSTCTSCHAGYAGAAHSHHDTATCIDCHMPRKNLGLAYELSRYHRIGSPTDADRVLADRPLECALCHRDRSVDDLVGTMERWWGKHYDRGKLRALYGDLGADAITTTLARGKPHEQAVAIAVLGDRGTAADVDLLRGQLAHPFPQIRLFAQHALAKLIARR